MSDIGRVSVTEPPPVDDGFVEAKPIVSVTVNDAIKKLSILMVVVICGIGIASYGFADCGWGWYLCNIDETGPVNARSDVILTVSSGNGCFEDTLTLQE